MTGSNPNATIRALARLMAFAVIAFAAVCTAAQFWRTDLNWVRTPLSTYLYGPGSIYVHAVYDLMAIALIGFAWASYAATPATLRSGLAAILFASAGFTLTIVAGTELFRHTQYGYLARMLHQITTAATFLWLSFGMLLVSSRWLRDARMKKGGIPGVVLAWAATLVLWFQVLVSGLPNGLWEKLAIVLILTWLGWAARQLLRATRPA